MNDLPKPDHLTVNLLSFAYDVDANANFSWWNHCDRNGLQQVSYRMIIAKLVNDLQQEHYALDTGWVESDNNSNIELPDLDQYLEPQQLYHWQVQIRDNQGRTSELSNPAKFIYCQGQANVFDHGIWLDELNNHPDQLPNLGNLILMRSPHFQVDVTQLDSAVVSLLARGNESVLMQACDLFVNGENVGFGSARPQAHYQRSDRTAIFYNSYDITSAVKSDNVIALAVTGTKMRNDNASDPNASANHQQNDQVRSVGLRLVLYYNNGNQQVINADPNWRAFDATNALGDNGQRIRSQYFGMPADNVDMQYYPSGWMKPEFDDYQWSRAMLSDRPLIDPTTEILLPFTSEKTQRFVDQKLGQRVIKLGEGDWLVDLGKEIIGSLVGNLQSKTDQRVVVWTGEQLTANNHVRHHLAAGPDYIETWHLVKGMNRFHTYQIKNFRYVEIRGFNGDLHENDLLPWAIRQPFVDSQSDFASDNELLNRQYWLSKYTIKATNQDVYVDSQARERKPYEGDLMVNANTSYAISAHYSLARHSIDYLFDNPTWPEDYRFFLLEAVWQDYLYTGNQQLLVSRYQDLKDNFYYDGQDRFDPATGLVTGMGLVDWPIKERDGFVEGKYNVPFNAVYAGGCNLMSKIAKVLGQVDDYKFYRQRYRTIKQQLNKRLYNYATGRYYDSLAADGTIHRHSSHHSSAYALAYGMFDNQEMADRLSIFVFNHGSFIGSIYFIYFMLRGLINTNHADMAVKLLTNPDNRSNQKTYAAIMDSLGATITPEAWSNAYKPNLTLSHPWGAAPGLTLIQGLMGINPVEPGFKHFRINIRPGMLNHLRAQVPCTKGMIKVTYDQTEDQCRIQCQVPMGSSVEVVLPEDVTTPEVNNQSMTIVHHQVELPCGDWQITY